MDKKYLLNYILLGLVGALVFCLTYYIEWYGDALLYRFDFGSGAPVDSAGSIFASQWVHYMVMNGRIWAHVLCQAFSSMWGQTVFAVSNALVYIAFVMLFARVCGRTWRRLPDLLVCILAVLFFCDTSYIANCQIGYIWTSAATVAFIIMYMRSRTHGHPGAWRMTGLFLLALLAGNSNEAIAIGTGAALIVDLIRNFKRLTAAQWVMIAGFDIGGLLLCLSPGILERASGESANIVWSVFRLLGYSRMLYVLLITLAVLKIRRRIRLKEFARDNCFFIVALATLLVFNLAIGIGELSGRQLFGVELFSAILTVRALNGVKLPGWLLAVATVAVAAIYVMKFDFLRKSNEDIRALRRELEQTDDMKVYVDFHRYTGFVHPTELWNNYRIYEFVASSIYDDISDFGHYYYNHKTLGSHPPYYGRLAVYPRAMRDVLKRENKNFAKKCDDGLYLVVQDTLQPGRFVLERSLNILGIRRAKEPYEVEFTNQYYLDTGGTKVVYSDFATPLVENGEIRMTD